MAKFYRGDVIDNAIVFSPEGAQVFSGMRGKPSADMLEAECDEKGNLLGNHRPVLLADLKRQEAQRRKLEAAMTPKANKPGSVKRYFLNDNGQVEAFGTGPVTYAKWSKQVYGENDPTLIRPSCTEADFKEWKVSQNYVDRTGAGSSTPKLRDELAMMREQIQHLGGLLTLLAATPTATPTATPLEQQQAATSAPTGKAKQGKAQQPE